MSRNVQCHLLKKKNTLNRLFCEVYNFKKKVCVFFCHKIFWGSKSSKKKCVFSLQNFFGLKKFKKKCVFLLQFFFGLKKFKKKVRFDGL